MDVERRLLASTVGLALVAVVHGALTWGPAATARFVVIAVVAAFVAEVAVIRLGLLEHHTGPQLVGVPLAALAGWTGSIYVAYRVAALAVDPTVAPLLAGVLATAMDVLTDPPYVEVGAWSYPPARVSEPRYRGVPWWNFAGWFVLTAAVSWAATPA